MTAEIHRLAASGLANVLRSAGVIRGNAVTRADLGLSEQRILLATAPENYVLAPESGVFETVVDLGQRVAAGEPVGRIHFLERPDRPPEIVLAEAEGVACVIRAIAPTAQGDCVVVIAHDIDRASFERGGLP